jgi:hypothetical protein
MVGTITPYGIGGARSLDCFLINGGDKPMAARFSAIETMVMADALVIVGTSVADIATSKRAILNTGRSWLGYKEALVFRVEDE